MRKIVLPGPSEDQQSLEQIEFEFRSQKFRTINVVPASTMLKLARIFKNLNSSGEDDSAAMFEAFEGQYEMLLGLVVPDDKAIVENVIENAYPPVSMEELGEVISVVTSELLSNPTQESSDSLPTTTNTANTSMAPSSPVDIAADLWNSPPQDS